MENNFYKEKIEKAINASKELSGKDERAKISNILLFYVNGKEVKDDNIEPEWTLLYYLRNKLRLKGTKLGCSEGGCGACTVMISRYDRKQNKHIHVAANACLTPVCAVHGMAVTTTEGIGSTRTKLHPVQERIAKAHGSQCGFCTPGIVMSMYALLRTKPQPTMEDIDVAFKGNLCRCTGYRAIIEGYKTLTEEWETSRMRNGVEIEKSCAMGDACCKRVFTSEPEETFDKSEFLPYDPITQEPIFPPKLQLSSQWDDEYLIIEGKEVTWYRPTNIREILMLKQQHPNSKIIVGNTEVGVEVKFKHSKYPVLIQPTKVEELCDICELDDAIRIGASATLVELEEALCHQIETKPEEKTRIFQSMVGMLNYFASKQIRNVAAIGGNIMTGSPVSDLNPLLMAAGVKLNVCSLERGVRSLKMNSNFFVGYRNTVVAPDEVLLSIEIPYSTADQYFVAYKQSKRRDDDVAIVNLAMNIFFEPGTSVVSEAYMAFGGMAPITILVRKTCDAMIGKKWNERLVELVTSILIKELPLSGDAPGGMILYRRSLTLSLFFKGFIFINLKLRSGGRDVDPIPKEFETAADGFRYQPPSSSQYFQVIPKDQADNDLIGRPIVHINAFKQAAGEAIYCDDIPKIVGELYLALVLSTKAHAKIINVDPTQALAVEGVEAFIDARDIPEHKRLFGSIVCDEEIFISKTVTSQGQTLGAIVAVDQATAQKAAKLVKVEYEELKPIITIEDAIEANSFFENRPKVVTNGNVDEIFLKAENIIEGEIRVGGQEHFYLETHSALANFRENGELELFSATQNPAEIQKFVAHVLDLSFNRVNVRVKRVGGGFGGKEGRAALVALPVAIAAYKLQRPVRCALDRNEDMMITGTRHPFLMKYKVSFTNEGRISAAEAHLYANCGYSLDLSSKVVESAMLYFMNTYRVPVVRVFGYTCKTNLPSNTAFRGFGGPQGMFCAENIIRHIAEYLERDYLEIAELNLYKEGDVTFYNQTLVNCTLRRCWSECLFSAQYKERNAAVNKFNSEHRFKKRGLSVVPVMFGVGFDLPFLNQGGALVHVYTDGSVLLNHGGVEMGQGLYTKMIQVASRVLKVKPEKIYTAETSTDKVPNTVVTAASLGSDLNGMAVLDACAKIMGRIKYIIDENPNGTWEDWVTRAYLDRVNLSATGYYRTPKIGYDFETNSGLRFNYYTFGVACSEVEIDCLTGDHQVLKADIVMDLGESLNPAIDIGQIEGAFMQGYGLFTMEEMIYSPSGTMLSRGPGVYKIPGFADIPLELNVSLLKGTSNPRAVYSSKAVGEPPLFLASSVFFAIKEAIKASREEMNIKGYFRLDSPATSDRIRMACVDSLIKKIGEGDGKKAWSIIP